jgi:Cyclic nucleotide-binding domain
METMRHESSVTSLSWIPTEAISGAMRMPFDAGLAHYDAPPPDQLDDLEALRAADRFRFANRLAAYVEVDDDGAITEAGYSGEGFIGSTTMRIGELSHTFQAFALPDLRAEPEHGPDYVRFSQTAGGRTGVPMPRKVRRPPFVQWNAPLAWTTLSLTIHADGHVESSLAGASRFPRHWVYDETGAVSTKSGLIDFKEWAKSSFGKYSPWGDQDSEAFVTTVESALERSLSAVLMSGSAAPRIQKLKRGAALVREGDAGTEVFLVLDGVVRVEKDGERLAEYGPGAILGERSHLEGGTRTSTLVAVTPCRVAAVDADQLDRAALEELSEGHRREATGLS